MELNARGSENRHIPVVVQSIQAPLAQHGMQHTNDYELFGRKRRVFRVSAARGRHDGQLGEPGVRELSEWGSDAEVGHGKVFVRRSLSFCAREWRALAAHVRCM